MMERRVTGGTRVILEPTARDTSLDRPIFAINWFRTRSAIIYDLYNMLAARSVFAVGAKVLFKGRLVETLSGDEEFARDVLLVVNYPSGERFLDLLAGKVFQAVSVLRVLAVRDFSFALNERVDGLELLETSTQPFAPDQAWAVLHFSSDRDIRQDLPTLQSVAAATGLEVFFASQKVAVVKTQDRHGEQGALDHITDKVLLLSAPTRELLRTTLLGGGFQDFARAQRTSYIGLLERVL